MSFAANIIVAVLKEHWYIPFSVFLLEWIMLRFFLHLGYPKALLISLTGNVIALVSTLILSGVFTTVSPTFLMIFILLGSTLTEVFLTSAIFKIPVSKSFIPLSLGNIISALALWAVLPTF
ncbi:MAG: hypothetical protein IPG90_02370 [Bacteroidetes bacterium]|nr:hypothetical protein [Bacteroidota bacterium]MBK9523345.1 hypothetical protein [Bacteroidota bacterium]MBK9541088.1 hypothetical protein [Bacteroidota bacterium]MBP6401468.1 hypothetical protein [Bacteroidia bacterium]